MSGSIELCGPSSERRRRRRHDAGHRPEEELLHDLAALPQARIATIIPLRNSRRLELMIEGFNLTNHVNYRPPLEGGANMNAPSFLVRTAARDARQLQWGLRYVF